MKNLYAGEYHPMDYITYVYDKDYGNKWADQRGNELGVSASPTTFFDGPFEKIVGSNEDVEEDMEEFNVSIIACGNRDVKDIDINLDVQWLGAVRNDPADGATLVPIEQIMTWTSSQMEIDIEVINNDASEYSSRTRVFVNEVNSTLWDDKWGDPYTHTFLDYAVDVFEDIPAEGSWSDTVIFDGFDIIVTAAVFRNDTDKYTDEATSVRTGIDTDPKRYDIYFGNTTPPPLLHENFTTKKYVPSDDLNWADTYYWKIDERDLNDEMIYGDIWSFTTRGNDPPNTPDFPTPANKTIEVPIEVNLTWRCIDPDGDDITFDVWFGDEFNIEQVAYNQTENWFYMRDLNFVTTYYWYVVAWEVPYDLYTVGPLWNFRTELNQPPNQAVDPRPYDGDPAVPTENVILKWNGSDPNFGDKLRFDLYFDDTYPPTTKRVSESYQNSWQVPFTLTKYKTYYWQIDTYDKSNEFTTGKIWSFITGDNNPPTDPIIEGPPSGGVDKEYEFTFFSTDPENHDIKYVVKWGDGTEETTDLMPNATTATLSHTWNKVGEKTIQAMAIDEHNAESDWSTFTITIPRNKVFNFKLLELLFTRFPNAFPILRQLISW
jgi:hypothetical protein